MWAGRSLGMILHTEDRQFLVAHTFHRAVIQINVRDFHIRRKRLRIDCESVILCGNGDFAGAQILHWLVRAAMAKFQFECRSAECESENLMTETNAEDRLLAHQIMDSFMRVGKRCRIAWAVGEKNSIRIKTKYFVCRRYGRDNGHLETFLAQQTQNIFLDAIIVRGNSKSGRWQRSSVFSVTWLRDRPRRAEFVLRVP